MQAVGKDGDAWLASALRNPSEAALTLQCFKSFIDSIDCSLFERHRNVERHRWEATKAVQPALESGDDTNRGEIRPRGPALFSFNMKLGSMCHEAAEWIDPPHRCATLMHIAIVRKLT